MISEAAKMFWSYNAGKQIGMVCWLKDAEIGTFRKWTKKVHGCSERGHEGGACEEGGCRGNGWI